MSEIELVENVAAAIALAHDSSDNPPDNPLLWWGDHARAAIRALYASAVPEEIAEVVQDLRDVAENLKVPVPNNAEGYVYYAEAMVVLHAADLLERLAGLHPHDPDPIDHEADKWRYALHPHDQEQRQLEGKTDADGDQQQDHGVKGK